MMYGKLIFRNAMRSAKDYLVYIVTMTVCVMLFYAFLSISSRYYKPDIGTSYDITMLGDGMKMAICAITLLLLFLIRYVNNYMLLHRQREFAIQSVMGMEQKIVGWLFFAETFVMGALSIVFGIVLGVFCSQFITAMLLASYGKMYKLTWTLFPDTVLLTVVVFTTGLFLVGLSNVRAIRKIKIIDMLYADKFNEPERKKSRFMFLITILYLLGSIFAAGKGLEIRQDYFDNRYPLPVHVLFGWNMIVPVSALSSFLLWALRREKRSVSKLAAMEAVFSFLCAIGTAGIPLMRGTYHLAYGRDIMNQYIILMVIYVICLICGVIFLLNRMILAWKAASPEHRYQGENLFLLGQITSKLSSNTKTMSLISITLVASICLFMISPVLTNWIQGFLDIRAVYDIQITSSYNRVYEEEDLPESSYDMVTAFMKEQNIEPVYDLTFSLYLPKREDFTKRRVWEFPVVAIALSDYNTIREMLGYDTITLAEGEFSTQWYAMATEEERQEFLRTHTEISTDGGTLVLAENGSFSDPVGEAIYNSYTDVLYIFPDEVCSQLLAVNKNRFITTKEPVSSADAQALEASFYRTYSEDPGKEGAGYAINTKTMQTNSALTGSFILKASMNYGAIVLMVMCLTILSLQQLLDADKYGYRFSVLRKLGVEERNINRLVLKQLGVWFGLPVLVAILASTIAVTCFLQSVSAEISAYIGVKTLFTQVSVTIVILVLLLACYFVSTLILFRKSMTGAKNE